MYKGVITGDIVNSGKVSPKTLWQDCYYQSIDAIKVAFPEADVRHQIFRGDSFQVDVSKPEIIFLMAVILRASFKSNPVFYTKGVDVRLALGIGKVQFYSNMVNESDGEAYQLAGKIFDLLKKHNSKIDIETPWNAINTELKIGTMLCSSIIDDWPLGSAEVMHHLLLFKETQVELALKLGISQPAINKRLNRAHFTEITIFDQRFQKLILQQLSHAY